MSDRRNSVMSAVCAVVVSLVGWIILAQATKNVLLPAPLGVMAAIRRNVSTGALFAHAAASCERVVGGLILGVIAGTIAALLVMSSRLWGNAFRTAIGWIRPVPPIAWVPFAILWFGNGTSASVFIVTLATFFPVFTNVLAGIKEMPREYIELAMSYDVRGSKKILYVLLPASLPSLLAGLRIAIGLGWGSVIAAEMVGAQSGLGYSVQLSRMLLDYDSVVLYLIVIALLAGGMLWLIGTLEKRYTYVRFGMRQEFAETDARIVATP